MAPRLLLLVHLVHLVHLTEASRRLASTVDLRTLETQKKNLGTSVHFKLDGAHRLVREGLAPTLAATVARTLACGPATRVFRYAGKHERRIRAAGLDLWYAVACAAPGDGARTLAKFKRFLDREEAAHDGVALAEVSVDAALAWTPNDPKFSDQASHYDAIRLREAWDVETGRSDVVVQVVDTGIDVAHPDLQDAIWTNAGEVCGNGLDDDGNGYVDDCHGYNFADDTGTDLLGNHWHGTHTGGTVAASTNNGVGVAGVAGGDGKPGGGVKLMVSVGFGNFGQTGNLAEAIVYGANNGAHVTSNSWGFSVPGMVEQTVLDAIDYFNDRSEEGGVVVFAAGNSFSDEAYYPAYYEGAVAVAATDDRGFAAPFTNYGSWVDVAAPGVDVLSTMTMGADYGRSEGTSMSCPMFAGVLALGKSVDLAASRERLLVCAYSTAQDVDAKNGDLAGKLGAGVVDARAFLDCVRVGAPSRAPTLSLAPTTAAPSPAPSVSAAPTPDCDCDQSLVFNMLPDLHAYETTWSLKVTETLPGCAAQGPWQGGPYLLPHERITDEVADEICEGQTYEWEIYDAFGDGICCAEGVGSYYLDLDGTTIHEGGEFASSEKVVFVAPAKGSGSGEQATFKPIPTPTQPPSFKPTWAQMVSGPPEVADVAPVRVVDRSKQTFGAAVAVLAWSVDEARRLDHYYAYDDGEDSEFEDASFFTIQIKTLADEGTTAKKKKKKKTTKKKAKRTTADDWETVRAAEGLPFFKDPDTNQFYFVLTDVPCGSAVVAQVAGTTFDGHASTAFVAGKQSKTLEC